jgi:nitrous oxide reductase accessory protein NosL
MKPLITILAFSILAAGCEQVPDDPTPRIIREIDGCTVYRFKEGGYSHYFTRCGTSVSTDRNYSVRSGKTSHTVTETIVTEQK